MNQHDNDQADLHWSNERVAHQHVGVLVERVLPKEHQQVSGDVQDEIQKKKKPGDADDEFGGNEGGKHAAARRHQRFILFTNA